MPIVLPNRFTPRWYQAPLMRYLWRQPGGSLRAVEVLHRRGGKDLTALHATCVLAQGPEPARCPNGRIGAYWHVFPTAEQGRKAIWEGFTKDGERIMEQVFPRSIRKSPREFLPKAEMVIEMQSGSIWRLLGSDKIEVVGAGPVGVTFSEYAVAKPSAWNMIRPMLRENGGWAAFIYTPRGKNHGHKIYETAKSQGWYHDLKTLYDTRAYDPEETIAAERAEGMPEALIRQEYLCDWTAANVGAVFGDLVPEVATFDHPADGVYTSWDLGVSDATAIWFWRLADGGVDFIDHYEATGKSAEHFIGILKQRGYDYVRHYLPHDGRDRTWVTTATPLGTLEAEWPGKVDVLPNESLANGIQAGRWLLQQRTRFHARCTEGVEALKAYHYEWDEDRKTLARLPMHDWSSHTADAFRYAASVVKFTKLVDKPQPPKVEREPPMVIVEPDGSRHLNRTFADMAKIGQRKPTRRHV